MDRYVAGAADAPGFENPLRLASNESAWGPSSAAKSAFAALKTRLQLYPDREARRLREALAARFEIEAARICCGNGSDELINLLARVLAGPGSEVVYSAHGFLMYRLAAKFSGAVPVAVAERSLTVDVDAILAAVTPKTRLVFVANPNNPTGTWLPKSEIARLHAGLPAGVVLALDAAYAEYVEDENYESGLRLAQKADNVVVLRTFSKIHGLAALRIGWLYGPPDIVARIDAARPPFNANASAQAAACASVNDPSWTEQVARRTNSSKRLFQRRLEALKLEYVAGEGNFVLVRFPESRGRSAQDVFNALRAVGILVRPVDTYNLPEYLRITIGITKEMNKVAIELHSIMYS